MATRKTTAAPPPTRGGVAKTGAAPPAAAKKPANAPAAAVKTPASSPKPAPSTGKPASGVEAIHQVTAGQPVTYETSGHPPRTESPAYIKARAALMQIAGTLKNWYFEAGPYQDHHGGGLWVNDGKGWFFVRNLVGIEWSGQFCADPAKVDVLRQNAARLYARFPESFAAFQKLGIDLKQLIDTPITDANGISLWTDSICNASVPLPEPLHIGEIPKGGGVHNYPTPVTDIDRFRRDDFTLWVTDAEGKPAAVVPKAPLDSADRSVRVAYATPGTKLHAQRHQQESTGQYLELPADHPLAKEAFQRVRKKS